MKKRKAGRPVGSKNKTKVTSNFMDGADLKRLATHYATVFICSFHAAGAEKLVEKILEQIRAKKNNGKGKKCFMNGNKQGKPSVEEKK